MTCGKDCNLIMLINYLQHLLGIRTNIEACVIEVTRLESNVQADVWWALWVFLTHAVSQGLVQIKDQKLRDALVLLFQLDVYFTRCDVSFVDWVHVLKEV